MPNKDGGHYFLTCLIPVLRGAEFNAAGEVNAPTTRLREILALTPVRGEDGPGAGKLLAGNAPTEGYQGPFARNLRNHFVRFAVLEDINDNGRMNGDGLLETIGRVDPIKPQWVDHLSRPYLLFTADIDSPPDGPSEPDSYLRLLWRTMEKELRDIFGYCFGFAGVEDAEAFARYIKSCQVETAMPFNDYWPGSPPLPTFPFLPFGALATLVGLAGGFLFDLAARPAGTVPSLIVGVIAGLVVAVLIMVSVIRWWAARPFPMAPHSDLPSVLKSLYLQREFVDFATASQGLGPDQLHAAFGAFLSTHKPQEPTPTQGPGVVGAPKGSPA
jgi:hypothetical protein